MNVAIVIQARMSSTRLPGKALLSLHGQPAISHLLRTCEFVFGSSNLFIATTTKPEDTIFSYLFSKRCQVFHGDNRNVVKRLYDLASSHYSHILRLTADCPLIPADLLASFFQFCLNHNADLNADIITNCFNRTFPRGFDMELISLTYLYSLLQLNIPEYHYEHVVSYAEENYTTHTFLEYLSEIDNSDLRLTLDEPLDLIYIQNIYQVLGNLSLHPTQYTSQHIINAARSLPAHNSSVIHKSYYE